MSRMLRAVSCKSKGLYWTTGSNNIAKLKWVENGKNCKNRCESPYT